MSPPRWVERISLPARMRLISIKIATLRLAGLLAREKISTCIMIAGMILLLAAALFLTLNAGTFANSLLATSNAGIVKQTPWAGIYFDILLQLSLFMIFCFPAFWLCRCASLRLPRTIAVAAHKVDVSQQLLTAQRNALLEAAILDTSLPASSSANSGVAKRL